MKKTPVQKTALRAPTNVYVMLDSTANSMLEMHKNQKELTRFIKAEIKIMNRFIENTRDVSYVLPSPWPPLHPMLPDLVLNRIPKVIKFEKEFNKLLKDSAKNFDQLGKIIH